jgi:hypothetical protein
MAAPTSDTIYGMADDHIFLGRITKNVGCGNVQVLLQTGETTAIPIGGAIRFRGKAANKSDRSNCMLTDDVVVVDGGFAAGKLTARQITEVRRAFKTAHFDVPKGFFCTHGEVQDDDAEETGFEFDRTGASAVELAMEEEEKRGRRGGGAGGGDEDYDIDLI